ncbi:biotin-dependent carboxyltransferase [Ideonella sp. 4Y16]|uniref:Biotin-dependent carboxyltransferase n=1 Tax=Ideonella alba TaxID=2824118 RepID=A0A941BJ38_9BURK|nr:biotin-dependent carboxyltransferase family protein [Ideonella alba]MBQ0933393.1 biotin-dependent carboxyltransferase [Ideonella alba]MBQ0943562.1 biotin-dependent carboxyltransferase [Ideonella alba]
MIEVLHPGLQTQLQDSGRWGWQADGVPVGGAMDGWSHRVANLLVGNADDEATLEILLQGPRLRFARAACIALVGAELPLTLDGQSVPAGQRLPVPAGAELACGRARAGLRAYLAVQGGFDVPPVLGSRSTYVRGGFGGWQGRALQAGDRLPLGPAGTAPSSITALADTSPTLPDADRIEPVLVVPGEHWAAFPADVRRAFGATAWRVGPQSDRMGYRLQGPALGAPALGELLSEGVAFGTVQVPPDGQPIVLMAERQSTGGYPKIAHVAAVDLPLLAQMAPGQRLRFELISADRAQALLEDRERHLALLRLALLETP